MGFPVLMHFFDDHPSKPKSPEVNGVSGLVTRKSLTQHTTSRPTFILVFFIGFLLHAKKKDPYSSKHIPKPSIIRSMSAPPNSWQACYSNIMSMGTEVIYVTVIFNFACPRIVSSEYLSEYIYLCICVYIYIYILYKERERDRWGTSS
jgi:hypothetical protein